MWRPPDAGQVDVDDVEAVGQRGEDSGEVAAGGAQAVQQQERLAGARSSGTAVRSPVRSQALFSLCVLCRSSGFSRDSAPFEGWRIVLRCRCKQRFARQGRSSGRHEHRSPVQLAAGLTALSRCAIPHEMVTTERVAKSHSIIRSSRRVWCPCGDVGLGQEWGRPARCHVCVRRSLSGAACGEARRATASEPPRSLIKRRRAGGCRPWPDRGSPCSRCSAAQCRTMPDRPGSSPHARQWY